MARRLWIEEGLTPRGDVLVRVLEIPKLSSLPAPRSDDNDQDGLMREAVQLQRFRRLQMASCPCAGEWASD